MLGGKLCINKITMPPHELLLPSFLELRCTHRFCHERIQQLVSLFRIDQFAVALRTFWRWWYRLMIAHAGRQNRIVNIQ